MPPPAGAWPAGRRDPALRAMHFVAKDLERVRSAIDAWAEQVPPLGA